MQNEEHTALESIIKLSDEPIEQLSTVIGVFNENVDFYQKMPFIVKPFLKRDLSSLSHLTEKEWLDLLNNIIENFEKIKSTASSIKEINKPIEESSSTNDLASLFKIKSRTRHITKIKNVRAKKENILVNTGTSTLSTLKEKITVNNIKFCPECGHKCQGKKSLTEHIYRTHYNRREEILKAVELYGI